MRPQKLETDVAPRGPVKIGPDWLPDAKPPRMAYVWVRCVWRHAEKTQNKRRSA
jgi:hypothetical protein